MALRSRTLSFFLLFTLSCQFCVARWGDDPSWRPLNAEELVLRPTERDFLLTTVPKSGTNFLANVLCLMTGRGHNWLANPRALHKPFMGAEQLRRQLLFKREKREFALGHWCATAWLRDRLEQVGTVVVFCIRDPRDVALSLEHWMSEFGRECPVDWSRRPELWDEWDRKEKLTWLITSGRIEEMFRKRIGWMQHPGSVVVRYEDLVGDRGGGSDEAQYNALRRIAEAIGFEISDEEILEAVEGAYGIGRTFHRGLIERWRSEMGEELQALCEEHLGDLLRELGYAS